MNNVLVHVSIDNIGFMLLYYFFDLGKRDSQVNCAHMKSP